MKKHLFSILALFLCVFAVSAGPVTGVSLDKASMTLPTECNQRLWATISPDTADIKDVTWTSSNPTVATVDTNGVVTSLENGTTIITVTTVDGGFTASCNVTVWEDTSIPVQDIKLNKTATTLVAGETETLTVSFEPQGATNKTIYWLSNDVNVARVSSSGLITTYAVGKAIISASTPDGTKKAYCEVNVLEAGIYTVNVSMTPGGVGSVTGTGKYVVGMPIQVTASVDAGYVFQYWLVNGVQTNNAQTFIFTANKESINTLVAVCKKADPVAAEKVSEAKTQIIAIDGVLQINSPERLTSVEVYSVIGKLLYAGKSNSTTIQINNLPRGVLIVKVNGLVQKAMMR